VDVHGGYHAYKLSGVNEPLRRGTELALIDELVERGARDAELARSLGFGESDHGRALEH